MEAVEADGLVHTHASGRIGLDGVRLTVSVGERVAVLGRNGSGKTTLLRVLGTALRPDGGSLRLLGEPVPPAPPSLRRRLGVALDRPAHLDALTGRENVRLLARVGSTDGIDAALAPLLRRFDLADVADAPVSAWSLGMRRKLLIVEAAVHGPELFVLDEPFLGLDPPAVDALLDLLDSRATEGTAAVVAVNDPVLASRFADRVVFLDEGRVVADAPPGRLLARVGAEARCTVELARDGNGSGPGRAAALQVPGVRLTLDGDRIHARLEDGPTGLPRLVEALVRHGFDVRSLRVREPDLGDAYRLVTGRGLEEGRSPAAGDGT